MAKSRFIATILLLGSGLRVSNYRRTECAPRPPRERRQSRPPHGTAVGGNQTHLPASATNEVVELGTVACICVCEWVVADVKGLHAAFNGIERRRESSDRRISDVTPSRPSVPAVSSASRISRAAEPSYGTRLTGALELAPIGDQAARTGKIAEGVDRGQLVPGRKHDDQDS